MPVKPPLQSELTPFDGAADAMSRLDPRQRLLLRLHTAFLGTLAVALVLVLQSMLPRWAIIPAGPAAAVLAIMLAVVIMIVPERRYRSWSYRLFADELHIKQGVWTRFYTIIPTRRIQHIDVAQDPAARWLGLASLVVHTAGTRSSSVAVPGLALSEAERLRDQIRRSIRQNES